MPRLLYLSLMRMPTEKAHGLQIAQNCEAFADCGYEVELWVARRWNSPEMRRIKDPYAYYGVKENFKIARIPCIDLMPLSFRRLWLERIAFYIQMISYILVIVGRLLFIDADIFYSRDESLSLVLSLLKPKHKIAYEAHLYSPSMRGRSLQSRVVRQAGSVIAITAKLRDDLIALGADQERIIVAHDGIRKERFLDLPEQARARQLVGWPQEAFIVGFIGRLRMIGMDKGVGALVEALQKVGDVSLGLVGGPDEIAMRLWRQWLEFDMDEKHFLYAGHVSPDEAPVYLCAFDLCVMPHPFTEQFAYYTSPLKLFEYMASGRAIIASDLPGWSDVIAHEETAILVPPSDVDALAEAIRRLKEDANLRFRLAQAARERVMEHYTWAARAKKILAHIERAQL